MGLAALHPEIIAIIKGHPLYPVLSANVTVPDVYITQMWSSLTFTPGTPTEEEFFQFTLSPGDIFSFRFDLDLFRRTLNFPLENAYPDKNDFDAIPDEQIMIDAVNALGYEGRFKNVLGFHQKFLSHRWALLYIILNRCLSPSSHARYESIASFMLKIFYGVAYHKHFDYAHIIWDQLITVLRLKGRYKKSLPPFVRFLSIMLNHFLKTKPEIPARDDQSIICDNPMKDLRNSYGSEIAKPAPIPNYLLVLADQQDPAIKKYRELALTTVPAQPQAPNPSEHREPGEGSSVSGSKRKNNEGKTNEGDLSVQPTKERRQKHRHDSLLASQAQELTTPTVIPTPEPRHCSPQFKPTETSTPETSTQLTHTSTSTPSVDCSKSVGGHIKKKSHKRKRVLEVVAEAEPEHNNDEPAAASDPVISPTLESQSLTGTGKDDADRTFHDDICDYTPVVHAPNMERQGGIKGVVEKSREIEKSVSEIGQRKRDSPPQPTPNHWTDQTTTISSQSHSQTTPQLPSQTTHQTNPQFRPSPTHTTIPTHSVSQSQRRPQSPFTPSVSPHEASLLDSKRLSFRKLRALFHTRLLVEPNLSPYDQAILSILNLSTTVTSEAEFDSSMLASRLDQIVSHLQNIDNRLTALESCRSFSTPCRRLQDDPDSQDPPEVEVRGTGYTHVPSYATTRSHGTGEGTSHDTSGGPQVD